MATAITATAPVTATAGIFSAITAQLAALLTALTAIQEPGYKITATARAPITVIRLQLVTTVIATATVTATAARQTTAVDTYLT